VLAGEKVGEARAPEPQAEVRRAAAGSGPGFLEGFGLAVEDMWNEEKRRKKALKD